MKKNSCLLFLSLVFACAGLRAQNSYQYSVNLNNVTGDKLSVELVVPKLDKTALTFSFPKIIPGTYVISDYGRFISEVKAWDNAGKPLAVSKQNDNQWKISQANRLHRVTYTVDDIFDSELKHGVYPMAATNIEEGKSYVFNTPGVFGFFEGFNHLPFTVKVEKPAQMYASTSLTPASQTATTDVFNLPNVDELYESPIMYSVPDTTTVKVANCEVLVSVYAPGKSLQSKQIASWMASLLHATSEYLGGRLPANRYAFLYYFKDPKLKHSFPQGLEGALEHPTSSFYYLTEAPAEEMKQGIIDMSSHEFFHIITPLTIASREVKEFNFHKPVMSKHLWLYEGSTEYTAHHVQVKYGLKTVPEYLNTLSQKITYSRTYFKDSLSFTEMSKEVTGKYKDQFANVYMKGALISACLDIYLLHLSEGRYGHRNLTYDLGVRYGKNRPFNDDQLFKDIVELTYPEIGEFLEKYVAGNTPIPYEYFFNLAGIRFTPKAERKFFSLGGFSPGVNSKGQFFIQPQTNFNAFGKKIGYKSGDEIYAFNGIAVNQQNFGQVVDQVRKGMKEGDQFTAKVGRPNSSGGIDTVLLRATVEIVTDVELNKLQQVPNPSPRQAMVQKAWLTAAQQAQEPLPAANPKDVETVDAIVKALYEVISGPKGPRNWDRFHSLFTPEAVMGATVTTPAGKTELHSFTPQQYRKMNSPLFEQSDFFEEEIGRNVTQYGNVVSVQSAYQFRLQQGGPVAQRGINYITLAKSNGRWYIVNLTWQDEQKDNPIPATMLKN
jgi:predicted metalloprotease with PDZ domain